jgi:hypothetical protein
LAKLNLGDVVNITGQETSAINTLNNNFAAIETAIENTFSRDGTSPNSLSSDVDLNMNDILNVNNIDVVTITVDGVPLTNEVYSTGPQGPQGPQGIPGEASPPASTTEAGILEISELSEALAGTPTGKAITNDLLKSIVDIISPVGTVQAFLRNSAPSGWLELNGLTIGNASSGGTARANADTETLFSLLWSATSDVDLPIYSSTGVLTTKGANAAADFAANKRLALPNTRGEFLRGWDNGRSIDTGRGLGSAQSEMLGPHSHTASTNSQGAHTHTVTMSANARFGANGSGVAEADFGSGDSVKGFTARNMSVSSAGAHTHTVTVDNNTGTENRPRNVSVMYCVRY